MPSKDTVAKEFFNRPLIIADICNQIIFRGKELVRPEGVQALPAELTAGPPGGAADGVGHAGGVRIRDSLHRITYARDGAERSFLLGLEFQSTGKRDTLFRPMDYDGRTYTAAARQSPGEGIAPVVTLLFNLTGRPWRHPCSLKERFIRSDAAVLEFLNYRMNLADPFTLDEKIIGGMCPELKTVIDCLRFSRDRESLEATLMSAPDAALSREAVGMLNAYLDFDLRIPEKEEGTRMCQAVSEWKQMLFTQGFQKGQTEGKAEGVMEGIAKIIRNMLQREIPVDQVHELTGVSTERILAIAANHR